MVFHSPTLRVTDKGFFDAVQTASENLQREPFVSKVETFYTTGIPDMVSPDNHTTYALVTLDGKKKMDDAVKLYEQAAAVEPQDAMERLDVEAAKEELEDE